MLFAIETYRLFRTALLLILIAATMVLKTSCREIYEPELDVEDNHLVVEALITDEQGPHIVRLGLSSFFGEDTGEANLTGAEVYITDSGGNEVFLTEKGAGEYHTPEDFMGKEGEIYILNIIRGDGEFYRSAPQEMKPAPSIDSIYADFAQRTFFYESDVTGDLIPRDAKGVAVFMDVSVAEEEIPRFRFETQLYLQFEVAVDGGDMTAPLYDFCWRKRYVNDILESDVGLNTGNLVSERNQAAFLPFESSDMRFLGFPLFEKDERTIPYTHPRVLNKSVYSLTGDAYTFHQARNQQLGDDGSLFDPVAPQLPTNIENVNDPGEVIVGFFEVSAVQRKTFNILPQEHIGKIEIMEIDCMHDIPNSGCMRDDPPDWWI